MEGKTPMSDWLKWHKGLIRKPEVAVVSKLLKLSKRETAATCMEFWEWVDDNTTDGKLTGISEEFIDGMLGVQGFARAMQEADWLRSRTVRSKRWFSIPNFDRHVSSTAKERALSQFRMARYRTKGTRSNERNGTVTQASPDERRVDERREDNTGVTGDAARNAFAGHAGKRRLTPEQRQRVDHFADHVTAAFGLTNEDAEKQRRAFAAVAVKTIHHPDWRAMWNGLIAFAKNLVRDKAEQPIKRWQAQANRMIRQETTPTNGRR